MALNYAEYLKLPQLLDLQEPRGDEHDELLFIIIHQVYELWFKQVLHELDKLNRDLSADHLMGAMATLKRVRTILKTLVGQLDILETMTPMSFSAFRDRLETASGFQSTQFRELEFLLGYKRPDVLQHIDPAWPGAARARQRLEQPSLVDHFHVFLRHRGVELPRSVTERDVRKPTEPDQTVQRGLLRLYREQPELTLLFELLLDIDEGLQEWRYRHVKLVERTIGAKHGTGGSPGVEFLKRSLFRAVFPDLWAIRHEM